LDLNFAKNKIGLVHALKKPSILFFVFSICFAFWFNDLLKNYSVAKQQNNFSWDGMGYYSYLPAIFYNNGSFDFKENGTVYLPLNADGKRYTKYPYGVALMELPFFGLAVLMTNHSSNSVNGFSTEFADYIRLGNILYVFLGLFFLRRFLLFYFDEIVTSLTLFCCLFGSMLYVYTFVQSEISHGYLFALFCVFIYFNHLWHIEQKTKYLIVLSFVLALISITRFTEIYIFVFFLFWNVKSFTDLKIKIQLFYTNKIQLLLYPLFFIVLWIPQLIYWKTFLGSYFTNPYVGEKFYWLDPQIINTLFSYRKGWLLYTPIAVLGLVGLFFIKKEIPVSKTLFMGLIVLLIYVFSCWWDWGYGGCFGNRAFCQLIAVLSIPIASIVEFICYKIVNAKIKNYISAGLFSFIFSCAFLNLGQAFQFQIHGVLHTYNMSRNIYWGLFRTYHYPQEFFKSYPANEHQRNYDAWRNGKEREDK